MVKDKVLGALERGSFWRRSPHILSGGALYGKTMKKNVGIILAGGIGKRMNTRGKLKQFKQLDGVPMLVYTLEAFCACGTIDNIVVVVPEAELKHTEQMVASYRLCKPIVIIAGGATRQESSFNALQHLHQQDHAGIVVIHDAVRPFVTIEIIEESIRAADKYGAADVAAKTADTIIEVKSGFVKAIPDRNKLYNSQTPQTFKFDLIYQAHLQARRDNFTETTDDIRLVLRLGKKVKLVESVPENVKITNPLDLELARVLARKLKCACPRKRDRDKRIL